MRLLEGEIEHADGTTERIIVSVKPGDEPGSYKVRGHDRPIDLPPGSTLFVDLSMDSFEPDPFDGVDK